MRHYIWFMYIIVYHQYTNGNSHCEILLLSGCQIYKYCITEVLIPWGIPRRGHLLDMLDVKLNVLSVKWDYIKCIIAWCI